MQITIQIPDDQRHRILDSFCSKYGYSESVDDGQGGQIPNPETKVQFTKRMVIAHVQEVVKAVEIEEARNAAAQAAAATPPPDMT